MPTWGNTDASNQKPKFDYERQTRDTVQVALSAQAVAGNNTINVVSATGIVAGQYVYVAGQGTQPSGLSADGYPGFFESNTTVISVVGTTVTLSANVTSNVAVGTIVEFDTAIAYNVNKPVELNYNQDTVLVTPTRIANTIVGNVNEGWNHTFKKINNDGTVRYLNETLVALANTQAANASSGTTSAGNIFPGV